MENRAHALIAGIFVLLLCAATAGAIWYFSDTHEETRQIQLITTGNVTGLNVQATVRYRGMPAGKVTAISIDPYDLRNLIVTAEIRTDLPLTRSTTASFGTQGVTGLAYINLEDDGTDTRPLQPEPGQPIRIPLQPGLFDRIGQIANDIINRYQNLTDKLDRLFNSSAAGDLPQRAANTLTHIENATANLDKATQDLPQLIHNLNALASSQNRAKIDTLLNNLNDAGAQTAPLIQDARNTLAHLSETLKRLDASGDQVFSTTLPRINDLLGELNSTAVRVGRLVEEIESRPQMLLSGRSRRQPGPGEAPAAPQQ